MSSVSLLPCITPQVVDFPPIEVSGQIRPQQFNKMSFIRLYRFLDKQLESLRLDQGLYLQLDLILVPHQAR